MFPLTSFKIFFFIVDFLKLEYDMPRNSFGGHFLCLVFSELPELVVWSLTLIWGIFQSLLLQMMELFLSVHLFLLVILLHVCFIVVPQFLDIFFFFFVLKSFCLFSFGNFCCYSVFIFYSFLEFPSLCFFQLLVRC